ncbi:MAG: WYL domain-containing protein [Clostridia bacterium]|nr:WYL domain-containing protein [Clostridia bacterium]
MAMGSNRKLKLLYLAKIFFEKTDEEHALTLAEITELLHGYDIEADRKTLYQDIEELRNFGYDIIMDQQGKHVVYRLVSRDFEIAELKLLVDSVQSSRFITEKKSRELIKKLEGLVSENEAQQLQRQVIIADRNKAMNESILINVDRIHDAIGTDCKISFHYFQWDVDKKQKKRRDGKLYVVSPWHLVWDDENYYLIAYDSETNKIKHYRVDKMLNLSLVDERREGSEEVRRLNIAAYSRSVFGMFGGATEKVTLLCNNDMAGVIIDRFGQNVFMYKEDEDHFVAGVEVVPSDQFIGWVVGLGRGIKVTAPERVVNMMNDAIDRLIAQYR